MAIYCIPVFLKDQAPLQQHCFGDCGMISIGGLIDTGDIAGPCWGCHQEQCPHEAGVAGPVGTLESTGDEIYIRVVKLDTVLEEGDGT